MSFDPTYQRKKFYQFNFLSIISDTRQDEDEQSGARGDRITTTSLIKFRPTSADDDITWACEAEHPALINPPLRTSVLLSVQRKYFCKISKYD